MGDRDSGPRAEQQAGTVQVWAWVSVAREGLREAHVDSHSFARCRFLRLAWHRSGRTTLHCTALHLLCSHVRDWPPQVGNLLATRDNDPDGLMFFWALNMWAWSGVSWLLLIVFWSAALPACCDRACAPLRGSR